MNNRLQTLEWVDEPNKAEVIRFVNVEIPKIFNCHISTVVMLKDGKEQSVHPVRNQMMTSKFSQDYNLSL
jgi:hypothetical protein